MATQSRILAQSRKPECEENGMYREKILVATLDGHTAESINFTSRPSLTRHASRSTLSRAEKLNYIDALKCLASKPARTPSAIAAGAKSRYDDFVVTHIQQTMTIHGTANFLSWHRYYLLAYENALRDECGYKGYQPYNNWSLWADDPYKSPLIDGSDTSLSGDGSFLPNRTANCFPNEIRCTGRLPPAKGGGCITDGPLKE
jgi:tyrosinase